MSENKIVVAVARKYHARCDYCGATEGVKWVTSGGEYGRNKIYCSPDCRDAAGMWSVLGFTIITSALFLYIISVANTPLPLEFYLAMFFFIGLPLILTIKGIRARLRVQRPSRFVREYDDYKSL